MPLGSFGVAAHDAHSCELTLTSDVKHVSPPPPMNAWMSRLAPHLSLWQLSIPGTHDSGAHLGGAAIECQSMKIGEQLRAGIRFIDVRLALRISNTSGHLGIFHDITDQNTDFDNVLDVCAGFLGDNPGETIVMSIKHEKHTAEPTYSTPFHELVAGAMARYPDLFAKTLTIPTLQDVRKRVVLLRRFDIPDQMPPPFDQVGLDCTSWGDDKTFVLPVGGGIKVQDHYTASLGDLKWGYFEPLLTEAADPTYRTWFINFLVARGSPALLASDMNSRLRRWALASKPKRLGTIPMDFPDLPLIKLIAMTNPVELEAMTPIPRRSSG